MAFPAPGTQRAVCQERLKSQLNQPDCAGLFVELDLAAVMPMAEQVKLAMQQCQFAEAARRPILVRLSGQAPLDFFRHPSWLDLLRYLGRDLMPQIKVAFWLVGLDVDHSLRREIVRRPTWFILSVTDIMSEDRAKAWVAESATQSMLVANNWPHKPHFTRFELDAPQLGAVSHVPRMLVELRCRADRDVEPRLAPRGQMLLLMLESLWHNTVAFMFPALGQKLEYTSALHHRTCDCPAADNSRREEERRHQLAANRRNNP